MRRMCALVLSLVCGTASAQDRPAKAPDGTTYLYPSTGILPGQKYPGTPMVPGVTYTLRGTTALPGWDKKSPVNVGGHVFAPAGEPVRLGAAAKVGCDCGPGCACPAGACAGGACGVQTVGAETGRGAPVAAPGTVLVEQTILRADGTTYTRVVTRPAGYVPMSGVTQAAFGGGTAARPGAAGTDDHTHTCTRCGTTWGGRGHSHSCPRCNTPQYVQDQPGYSPAPATYYPGRPVAQPQHRPVYSVGGGCASGGCANGACGMPAQFSPWR